jgi:hypothetical protein
MPTILSFLSGRQITNDSGVPQAGAKVYHYRATTTTNLTVWQDSGATVPHAQPVVCDAGGFVPLVYVDDTFDWKIVVKTASDVILPQYNFDNLEAAEPASPAATYSFAKYPFEQVSAAGSPVILTAADAGKAYEADTTGGNVEFDLPAAGSVPNGTGFIFKKTAAANSMIIDPNGAETIDDSATSLTITRQYQVVEILSNVAEWYVKSQYLDDIPIAVGAANALSITNNAATPTTQLDVVCSEAVLVHQTSSYAMRVGAQALTLNAASIGANGIDAGGLANSTWYHVWLISNGTTTACLLSLSATAPTMPSGYVFKYRIGAVRTGGSATFLRTIQKGNVAHYQVVAASTTPNLPIMSTGVTGDPTVPTWSSIATGNFVPPTAIRIKGITVVTAGSSIIAPNNAYGNNASLTNPVPVRADTASSMYFDFVLESANIFRAANNAGSVMACQGWVDAVNAN